MTTLMASRQLFRQEAIDFQRGERDFGEITLLQPVSTKLLAWALTAVVAAAIVFLCFAQFSRKQTVAGYLIPASGTMKVFPTREGVVRDLYVEENQHVKAGDPLFTVATPRSRPTARTSTQRNSPRCGIRRRCWKVRSRANSAPRRRSVSA